MARKGSQLLRGWRGFPGLTQPGEVDGFQLASWLTDVWARAQEASVLDGAERQLAFLFARSLEGPDGSWPHPEVRAFLERVASDSLERWFEAAVYQRRGIVGKDIDVGGDDERGLANHFRRHAVAIQATHPRTAAILERVAEAYAAEALDEDVRSQLDQDLLG